MPIKYGTLVWNLGKLKPLRETFVEPGNFCVQNLYVVPWELEALCGTSVRFAVPAMGFTFLERYIWMIFLVAF